MTLRQADSNNFLSGLSAAVPENVAKWGAAHNQQLFVVSVWFQALLLSNVNQFVFSMFCIHMKDLDYYKAKKNLKC